jgi:hypothetical protein
MKIKIDPANFHFTFSYLNGFILDHAFKDSFLRMAVLTYLTFVSAS